MTESKPRHTSQALKAGKRIWKEWSRGSDELFEAIENEIERELLGQGPPPAISEDEDF